MSISCLLSKPYSILRIFFYTSIFFYFKNSKKTYIQAINFSEFKFSLAIIHLYMFILKIKYFLNFKPMINTLVSKKKTRIYCKYFFFLLLFFEYYFYKKSLSICFKFFKNKKRINSILKAPHHYKIAQTKIFKSYYVLIFELKFKIVYSFLSLFFFFNIFKFFFFFNSNYIYLFNKRFFFFSLLKTRDL